MRVATVKTALKTVRRKGKVSASSPEARLEIAHAKFIQAREGTAEYSRTWETLLDTLVDE